MDERERAESRDDDFRPLKQRKRAKRIRTRHARDDDWIRQSIALDEETKQLLDDGMRETGSSASFIVRTALRHYLLWRKKEKKKQ